MAKKETKQKVRCIDCKNGTLMQWYKNPVVVQCPHLNCRDVASTLRYCTYFKQSTGEPEIKHLKY